MLAYYINRADHWYYMPNIPLNGIFVSALTLFKYKGCSGHGEVILSEPMCFDCKGVAAKTTCTFDIPLLSSPSPSLKKPPPWSERFVHFCTSDLWTTNKSIVKIYYYTNFARCKRRYEMQQLITFSADMIFMIYYKK